VPGPPQAVKASCNEDAKGKTMNYYFAFKFATRVSVCERQQS